MNVKLISVTPDAEKTVLYHETIKKAFLLGCRFNFKTQEFIYASGKAIPVKLYGKQKYPSITLSYGTFLLHKFVAFQLFGEKAFNNVVRHLDGNVLNLNKNNIALGTHSENNLDKPKHKRVAAAKKARKSQGIRPQGTILNFAIAEQIRWGFKNQILKKDKYCIEMAKQLKVSKSTIYAILDGRIWNESTVNFYNT